MNLHSRLIQILLAAASASAQHQSFAINPDSSEVKMTLKTNQDIVNGAFHVLSGSIDFDRTASRISGAVVVAAGSGKTGNNGRDKKMDRDVLKTAQYTMVSFAPAGYTGSLARVGDSTIQASSI